MPSVFIRGEGGSIFTLDLPLQEAIEDRLVKGYLTQVNEDGSPYSGEPEPTVPSVPTEAPSAAAKKADWVGWAVACGATPDDAEALTKTDLIEKYAAVTPAADLDPAREPAPQDALPVD